MPVQSKEIRSKGKLNYRYFFQGKEKKHLECKGIKIEIFSRVSFLSL